MTLTAETIMQFAIPVFFLLIGLELIVGLMMDRQFYRFNDAVANISCGIAQQVSGLIFKLAGLSLYVYLYQFRFFDIPNNWLTYIVLFVLIVTVSQLISQLCVIEDGVIVLDIDANISRNRLNVDTSTRLLQRAMIAIDIFSSSFCCCKSTCDDS